MKISPSEFRDRLSWTLEQKIDHSLGVIEEAINHSGGNAYVSFSGGKDSTVLLHLARRIKPDIKGVFFNTTNEFPEIYAFVKQTENVEWVNGTKNLKWVIETQGFPLISKEQSLYIRQLRTTKSDKLKQFRLTGVGYKKNGKISNKWMHMVDAPFDISERCCYWLKKKPAHMYWMKTKSLPIIGTMASESSLRRQKYLIEGCNSFNSKKPSSSPLSIWTSDDVWAYIRRFNVPYSLIYDKGVDRTGCMMCGFGCQFDDRFETLKRLHPKAYEISMNLENKGVSYRDAINFTLKL